jgi:hypothetical protein
MAHTSSADPQVLFNRKLEEFASDLATTFPEVKDFATLRTSLRMALTLTPALPRALFHQYVVAPYEKQILARDEQFFLDDRSEFKKQLTQQTGGGAGGDVSLDLVKTIQGIWRSLGEGNKDVIWKYLQVLVLLDHKCAGAAAAAAR